MLQNNIKVGVINDLIFSKEYYSIYNNILHL